MASRKVQYWNSIAKTFIETGPGILWRTHSDVVNIAMLDRWLPQGKTGRLIKTDLFDEAVSNGLYPFLNSKAENIIGLDISPMIVKAARRTCIGLKGTIADVRNLPFQEKIFDTIISISTIDHFSSETDIMNSLLEFHRALRKGGSLIITLDNPMNPVIALRSILPFRSIRVLGIVPYYVGANLAPRRLCRVIEEAGFEIAELDAVMHCPRLLAVAFARIFEKYAGRKTQNRFLKVLMAFESLSRLPTRFLTGYFVAVRAVKC